MNMTQTEFNEEFGDMMLHGLDSNSTYIPLRTNKSQGINVAIRPRVFRLSSNVVFYGGTLRVGYTMDEKHDILKQSVISINPDAAALRLKEFCKGFTWLKGDNQRFSTIIGVGIAASRYDGDAALIILEVNKVAEDFINRLERKYKQYNNVGFTSHKSKAIKALNAAWLLQSGSDLYAVVPSAEQLPEKVVGLQTGVLNQAQDGYGGNVVSFQEKVEDLAAAKVDKPEVEEETTASD